MVKVAGPAMSLEASGSLAGVMVFAKWKGRPYVRSLVRPSNPKSGGQVGVRAMFKFLSQNWAALIPASKATWEPRADQGVYSPFNAYMSYNQSRWRDFIGPTQDDPPTGAATPGVVGTIVATPGVRSATLTIPITTAADYWGVCVFRSLVTSFVPAFDNLVGVGLVNGAADVVVIDTPLEPDTYYYNFRAFDIDGVLAAAEGEETVIIA